MVKQIADIKVDYPKIIVNFNDYFLDTNDKKWEENFDIFIEKYINFNEPEKNYSIIIYPKINFKKLYFMVKKGIDLVEKLKELKNKNKYFCENTIIIVNNNNNKLVNLFFNILFSLTSPLSNFYLVDSEFSANKLFNKIYKKEHICDKDYNSLFKSKF